MFDPARIRSLIEAEVAPLTAIRRALHEQPEIGYEEHRTAERIRRELDAAGVSFRPGLAGGTGTLAHIPGGAPGSTAIGLRTDIDALPMDDRGSHAWKSRVTGRAHACGHDGHTTILLGAARVLAKLAKDAPLPNPVTLLFQPAEEGGNGGDRMVKDGALDGRVLGPRVSQLYGLHGWPQLPLGTVATRVGPLMAAVDDFVVTVRGTQCHGAYPHLGADPIVATAQIISALQTIASRNVGPLDSVVVTVGQINAGTANNIIPETCTIIGTVRTLKNDTKVLAKRRFFEIVEGVAAAMGCQAEIDWQEGYPVTENNERATEHFLGLARRVLGPARVIRAEHPTMGGEDFSFYGRHVPACFFFLGLNPSISGLSKASGGNADGKFPSLHQPTFDFNDEAIPTGVELFCSLALDETGV